MTLPGDVQCPEVFPFSDIEMRPIHGYPGYLATLDGRIFSDRKALLAGRPKGGGVSSINPSFRHEIATRPRKHGSLIYTVASLMVGRQQRSIGVHRLLMLAWVGPPPFDKAETRHLNNNPSDNRLENLAWGTRQENEDDKKLFGTRPFGIHSKTAKLTDQLVREIVRRLKAGDKQIDISKSIGISRAAIFHIKSGHTWRHVTGAEAF